MEAKQKTRLSLQGRDADAPSTSASTSSKVIYLGHLPHGFYEDELRGFFSQFGDISRLRVSRNKKTGKSKNYAFVEFKSPEVAAIAAEAMDGYFLYKQKLVCHLMAAEDQHETLFKGANRHFAKIPWRRMECRRHNKQKTPAEQEQHARNAVQRDAKRRRRIHAAGIDYDFEPLEQQVQKRPQHTTFEPE